MNEVMKKPESEKMAGFTSVEEKFATAQSVICKIGGGPAIARLLFSAAVLIVGVALFGRAITVAGKSAGEAFQQTRIEKQEEVYQKCYWAAYEKAEDAHHVSNRIAISVDKIRDEQKLECLW